jgi:cytosine/adenosine deaminase-related metal-dependent hydrolase
MSTQQRYLSRSTNVAARLFGGEVMIMSGTDSSLYSLNETASILWQAADGVTPLAQIVERDICTAYEVDPATALRDAEELAQELARQGILQIADAPLAPPATPSTVSP